MLNRRLVTTFPLLKTLGRASSTVASTPIPPAPASESSAAHQSPNYPTTWSTTQKPRPASRSEPRFEQTVMELQPNPLSAMELVANEPIRVVHGRKALCDGGGGPLGHPKIYINLDQPGPRSCGYVSHCSSRSRHIDSELGF
ncbi:hypothetical protein HD554DRAFT_2013975 [Boletus coccyginus]|nr:hypothetical protein HD554DRAFT_2013975 [Boletus coccyginus]